MPGRNTAAGNRYNFLAFTDVDGVMLGSTTSAPATGTSTNGGMLRIYATKRAPATVPNPDAVIVTGDDGEVMHEYDFPSIARRGFIVELAVEDLALAGVIGNVPVTARAGGFYSVLDRLNTPLFNMCGILQSRAKDLNTGAQQWGGAFIPLATARYLGRQEFNERTAALFRFFVTPQPAQNAPWGTTIVDNSNNVIQGRYLPFQGFQYPVTMHAFKGNGSTALYSVDYQPVSVPFSSAAIEKSDVGIASVQTSQPFGITLQSNALNGGRGVYTYQFAG